MACGLIFLSNISNFIIFQVHFLTCLQFEHLLFMLEWLYSLISSCKSLVLSHSSLWIWLDKKIIDLTSCVVSKAPKRIIGNFTFKNQLFIYIKLQSQLFVYKNYVSCLFTKIILSAVCLHLL